MGFDTVAVIHPDAPEPSHLDDRINLAETLAKRVKTAFPLLPMSSWRIDETGGDHVLLVVENNIVFRFPRAGTHNLNLEIAVLRALTRKLPVATPAYDYIDPAKDFAGYRYLNGSSLTPRRFAALPAISQHEIAKSIARFLSSLHRLPPNRICPEKGWPQTWTARQFSKCAMIDRLAVLNNLITSETARLNDFMQNMATTAHQALL